jgi:hypothetical protein
MTRQAIAVVSAIVTLVVLSVGAHTKEDAAQEKVDLTGTWILQVETSAGGGSPTFTFKQTGQKLEGTYEGTFGKASVEGSVSGNKATWSFTADAQGTQLFIEYTGTVEKDTMKGTVRLGELAEGTFTGKRK